MSQRATTATRTLAGAALAVTAAMTVTPAAASSTVQMVAQKDGGKPATARGEVTFDCILEPFRSAFRYQGRATVSGAATSEGAAMDVTATFPDLPGIAPVPIDNGAMHVSVKGTAGGAPMELTSDSTVNAEPKSDVPVPELTGTVQAVPADAVVELTTFGFAFEEMMGIEISADCEVTNGAHLGRMRAGQAANEDGPSATGAEDDGADSTAALAGGEAGDSLPLLALWALPVGVVVLGLLVWLPRRLRRS